MALIWGSVLRAAPGGGTECQERFVQDAVTAGSFLQPPTGCVCWRKRLLTSTMQLLEWISKSPPQTKMKDKIIFSFARNLLETHQLLFIVAFSRVCASICLHTQVIKKLWSSPMVSAALLLFCMAFWPDNTITLKYNCNDFSAIIFCCFTTDLFCPEKHLFPAIVYFFGPYQPIQISVFL